MEGVGFRLDARMLFKCARVPPGAGVPACKLESRTASHQWTAHIPPTSTQDGRCSILLPHLQITLGWAHSLGQAAGLLVGTRSAANCPSGALTATSCRVALGSFTPRVAAR